MGPVIYPAPSVNVLRGLLSAPTYDRALYDRALYATALKLYGYWEHSAQAPTGADRLAAAERCRARALRELTGGR